MKILYLLLLSSALALNTFAQTTIVLPRLTHQYTWGGDQGPPSWVLFNNYVHTYNSRGQETERVFLRNGTEVLRTIHMYENFKLRETLEQSKSSGGSWETTSKHTYIYDLQGRLINTTHQALSGGTQLTNLTRAIYTYTNNDLNPSSIERQIWIEVNGAWGLDEMDVNLVWSTDPNNPFKLLSYETQTIDFDLGWSSIRRHTNSYDPATRVLTSSSDFASGSGWVPRTRTITRFDAQMNTTGLLVQEWDYDTWKFLGERQYVLTYNTDNILTERITKIRMTNGGPLENLSREVYSDFQTFIVTGLAEQLPQSSLAVFPNPTSGDLKITLTAGGFKEARVQIVDLQGREMYDVTTTPASLGSGKQVIPLQHLSAGMYILRIITDNHKEISRRVVKN